MVGPAAAAAQSDERLTPEEVPMRVPAFRTAVLAAVVRARHHRLQPGAGQAAVTRHGLSPFHTVPLPFKAASPSPIQARSERAALRWQHSC